MSSKLTIFRKGLILIALPFLFQLAFVCLAALVQRTNSAAQARSMHSKEVLEQTQALLRQLVEVETANRGYMLTHDDGFLAPYQRAVQIATDALPRLADLVRDNPSQQALVAAIARKSAELLNWHAVNYSLLRQGRVEDAVARVRALNGKRLMDATRRDIDAFLAAENRLYQQRNQALMHSQRMLRRLFLAGAAIALAVSMALVAVFSRSISSRISTLTDNARRVLAGEELDAPLGGSDEVADLDKAFRAMVDKLTASARVLDEQRRLLKLILDSIGDAVIAADEKGSFLLFNRAAERIHGKLPDAIRPDEWATRLGWYLPDAVTPFPAQSAPLIRALRGEQVDNVDLYVRAPGSRRGCWLSVAARPLRDQQSKLRGGVVVCRDTTERRLSERQFQSLLESGPDAMVISDATGTITRVNAQTEKLFGYSAAELIGQKVECLVPARFRARHVQHRTEYMASPQTRPMGSGIDLFGVRKDGSEVPVEIALSTLEGQNGPLVYAAIRDCTQRKQAEEALRKLNDALEQRVAERTAALAAANEELAQRNRENEMFVYTVSHDLRSPLVNLQGFSNELRETSQELRKILAEKELPAEIKQPAVALIDGQMTEAIHFVQSAVLRLAGIIDALLRLSRAGRLEYRYQRVDLDPVVGRIVDSLALTLAERQAVVRATPLPPVWGDATAVEQVFANLIGNALNYLDPLRPGVIEVGAVRAGDREAVQAPRGLVTVYDRDNGLGIPERCKDKVFRAFQRIHPHAAPGEGMGLSIVQRIVERHCGKVWFESKEGAGTTFFVALPPAEVREPNRVVGSANSLELTCAVG